MLAKPEKNVRSAFTTSTVVRMHVGDAKTAAKAAKPTSSMANMFRRRDSGQGNVRYGPGRRAGTPLSLHSDRLSFFIHSLAC